MKNQQLVAAIHHLATERGLPTETVVEALEMALVLAYKRSYDAPSSTLAEVDLTTGGMHIFVEKTVVEDVTDGECEISLTDAREMDAEAQLDGVVRVDCTPDDFGRIAAQAAKQLMVQRIREAERESTFERFSEREGEIVSGRVQRYIPRSGDVIVNIEQSEGVLAREDQLPNERYHRGSAIRAYLMEVKRGNRGTALKLSRTHRQMLFRLLESQVPEIAKGIVEVKAIAREPGYRSKVAVAALQPGVEPVGCCVGMRGSRIQHIVDELNGEKIDVIAWSPDTRAFIRNALSPAKPVAVLLDEREDGRTAIAVVPDRQLSLSIGREGQNARLAAKLTGWRIDIKGETEAGADGLLALAQQQVLAEEERKRGLLEAVQTILRGEEAPEEQLVSVAEAVQEARGAEAEEMVEAAAAGAEVAPEAEQPVAEEELAAAAQEPAPEAEPPIAEVEPAALDEIEQEEDADADEESEEDTLDSDADFDYELYDEDDDGEEREPSEKRRRDVQRRRRMVYDDELGEMIAIRRHKRGSDEWAEQDDYL